MLQKSEKHNDSAIMLSLCACLSVCQVQWVSAKRRSRSEEKQIRSLPEDQGQWSEAQHCAHPQHATGEQGKVLL